MYTQQLQSSITPIKIKMKISNPYIIDQLDKYSKNSQMAQAKQIYNNKECRNIKKFLLEEKEYNKKMKTIETGKKNNTTISKYDENELMELKFDNFTRRSQKYKTEPSLTETNTLKDRTRTQFKTNRRITKLFNQPKMQVPKLQRRSTAIQNKFGIKQYKQLNSPLYRLKCQSPRKESQKHKVQYFGLETKLVEITEQRMKGYLSHLYKLLFGKADEVYQPDYRVIGNLIAKRYRLTHNQYQQNGQCIFQIPGLDMANKKLQRQSIHKVINMEIKKTQRLAFNIFDKNHNGIIDEKDILELFDLVNQFPWLENDVIILVRCMHQKNDSTKEDSDHNSKHNKSNLGYLSVIISNPMQDKDSSDATFGRSDRYHNPQQQAVDGTFKKSKYFTFQQTQQNFLKLKKQQNARKCKLEVNWNDFQKAFKNNRPSIFYDIINFLFGFKVIEAQNNSTSNFHRTKRSQGLQKYASIDDYILTFKKSSQKIVDVQKY